MSTHTKGPWQVVVRPDPDYIDVQAGNVTVAAVRYWAGQHSMERATNAVLIAAAPELLDLLRDAWLAVPITQHNADLHDRIKALIQRIEGSK
jgi:hypothetical protein